MHLMIGARHRTQGRHPRWADLGVHTLFLKYLMGILRSMVDTHRNLLENGFDHIPLQEEILDGCSGIHCPNGPNVVEEVAFRDLAGILYQRLAQRIPPKLQEPLMISSLD